jgi:hypothetical protein
MFFSISSQAALIDRDWQAEGDAGITYHTETGLEWLDVSLTANISVKQMISALQSGGQFEVWRYATMQELDVLIQGFNAQYACYSCALDMDERVFAGSQFGVHIWEGQGEYLYWSTELSPFENGNFWDTTPIRDPYNSVFSGPNLGHFLIREATSEVPLPAALLLFVTGLFGLIGTDVLKKNLSHN